MRAERKLHSTALNLDGAQFLSGWRPEAGTIFVPTLSEARVGDDVAIRLGIAGQAICATVFGGVSMVRRVGRLSLPPGIELLLDRASLPAARFLAMAARGEPLLFRERAPRYLVSQPLRVAAGVDVAELVTVNVSEGGCAVTWIGLAPNLGDLVSIRLGEGLFSTVVRAAVCWIAPAGASRCTVGLRVLAHGRGARAWRSLATKAGRSGAPVC